MYFCFLIIHKWADHFCEQLYQAGPQSQPTLEGVANSVAHLIPFWVWTGPSLGFSPGTRIWIYSPLEASSPAARSLKKNSVENCSSSESREREKRVEGRGARRVYAGASGEERARRGPDPIRCPGAEGSPPGQTSP